MKLKWDGQFKKVEETNDWIIWVILAIISLSGVICLILGGLK
jgi:hypothetical protein